MLGLGWMISCKNTSDFKKAEDAQDAARQFVQASLDGNYEKANFYLYKDTSGANEMLLNKWKEDYSKWTQAEKLGHNGASIIVLDTKTLNDSTYNFKFTNSFKKDTATIKVIKLNGEWLIDLKDIH